jgi:3-oxoacyl-[acyl-carrier-protein] synthase-3
VIYVQDIGSYVPEARLENEELHELTGRDPDWFIARTGIHSRSRAAASETTTSMGIDAVRALVRHQPDALDDVDLIIGASYTPDDTLSSLAPRIQREFQIENARVYFLSTACSSFISALEIAEVMLRTGESAKALVVVSEHNSFYSEDTDQFSGHLWGDGAAAVTLTTTKQGAIFSVEYARSRGVACSGKGPDAISLNPSLGSKALMMQEGRDVFARACEFLVEEARDAMSHLNLEIDDIDWFVPHQANLRIISNVAKTLGLDEERCVVTVDQIGNTGCASIPISIQQHLEEMSGGELVTAVAFGGGYSCGAAVLRKL